MRLLLLLFFFVAGTQAFTVTFRNNCTNGLTVYRMNGGHVQKIIDLPAQQTGTDTILVNENIEYDLEWHSLAKFVPAAAQRTNFTLEKKGRGTFSGITMLKPACASGQPCPAFRCGLPQSAAVSQLPIWGSGESCKKDGDTIFSDEVSGSRPNTMNYYITYCAAL